MGFVEHCNGSSRYGRRSKEHYGGDDGGGGDDRGEWDGCEGRQVARDGGDGGHEERGGGKVSIGRALFMKRKFSCGVFCNKSENIIVASLWPTYLISRFVLFFYNYATSY